MEQPLVDLDAADEEAQAVAAAPRRGFLPIATNWFDRLFIAIYVGVAIELLWMRFLEQAVPLAVAHVIVLVLGVVIVRKG
jgi:predicted small integral membrane protein